MSDLYRFRIRNGETSLDLRVARHPSESPEWLMTRVLARIIHHEAGMVFSKGICHGDWPAIYTPEPGERPTARTEDQPGRLRTWIDIGVPSPKKLNRGLRCAGRLILYTYGQPSLLTKALPVCRDGRIEAWHLDHDFLLRLADTVAGRAATWEAALSGDLIAINGLVGARVRISRP